MIDIRGFWRLKLLIEDNNDLIPAHIFGLTKGRREIILFGSIL